MRSTLDTSKTNTGNTEEFFVHQLLAEIRSDGSLALCWWQVSDRIRFRHCLSPCSCHLLNMLLHLRHWNKSVRGQNPQLDVRWVSRENRNRNRPQKKEPPLLPPPTGSKIRTGSYFWGGGLLRCLNLL